MDNNGMGNGQKKPAEALLSVSYVEGRRVGLAELPSELVPGQPGTAEHEEALKGWRSGRDAMARRAEAIR
jgi:hypothetical protein